MKKQKGEVLREVLIVAFILVVVLIISTSCNGKHEKEFYEYCHAHNGHVISEGHSFLSDPSSKYSSKLREICVDPDGKIVE